MSGVSKNVGMKMKQMLKPKAVPTVFPKALPNCSSPLYKKNAHERSMQKGERSQRTASRRHELDSECQVTLSVILMTTNRWVWILLCVSDYKENDGRFILLFIYAPLASVSSSDASCSDTREDHVRWK